MDWLSLTQLIEGRDRLGMTKIVMNLTLLPECECVCVRVCSLKLEYPL